MAESRNGSDHANGAGDKHQTDHDEPESKRQKQTTIEEALGKSEEGTHVKDQPANSDHAKDEGKSKEEQDKQKTEHSSESQPDVKNEEKGTAVRPAEEDNVPSNVLEKGIIYFFIRGRVGIDHPESVNDIARTYIMLRPIAKDAKLGSGSIGDGGNTRLLAVPKKVLPKTGKDRFMVFVEKTGPSFDEIEKDFLSSSDYETKTVGTRHTPAVTPVGEGVYALTTTGRESHLAYMLSLPEKPGSVQDILGLQEKNSFILSTKNPQQEGPANTNLPEGPGYPQEILDEFRTLRWLPTKPAHIDYVNGQVLFIGESSGLDKAVEPQEDDKEKGKEEPIEVLEHLEHEDLKRMKDLPGDQSASIFADLEADAKKYPKLLTQF